MATSRGCQQFHTKALHCIIQEQQLAHRQLMHCIAASFPCLGHAQYSAALLGRNRSQNNSANKMRMTGLISAGCAGI